MSYLKRIVYNCKKATLLIEKKEMGRLTIREFIELRIHLVGCSFCRLYKKQSLKINEMVNELFKRSGSTTIRLDDTFKKDLQERIESLLDDQN
jgi:hypothetical protein